MNQIHSSIVLAFVCGWIEAAPVAPLGGGNISHHEVTHQLGLLHDLGAGKARVPLPASVYWDEGYPKPERIDNVLREAQKQGIQVVFLAINEPMWESNNPTPIPPERYARALEGLADGVHAVGPQLRVSPGGYQELPLFMHRNRFLPAVASLYNHGKLHAIDIHRYWDVDHVPMDHAYRHSCQGQFDDVKTWAGITRDVAFQTTEMNFEKRKVHEDEAAKGFLTALWDALTVTGAQNQPVTAVVMPWNIFHTEERDTHYGLCTEVDPWTPNARGRVLRQVLELTRGMEMVSTDPKGTGITVLRGPSREVRVWQNRRGWSTLYGSTMR